MIELKKVGSRGPGHRKTLTAEARRHRGGVNVLHIGAPLCCAWTPFTPAVGVNGQAREEIVSIFDLIAARNGRSSIVETKVRQCGRGVGMD